MRSSDEIALIVDASQNPTEQVNHMVRLLEENGLDIFPRKSSVEVSRTDGGGLRIIAHGELIDCTNDDVKQLMIEYGYRNALVKLYGKTVLEDIEDAIIDTRSTYKPAVLLVNKTDIRAWSPSEIRGSSVESIPVIPISAVKGTGLDGVGRLFFNSLGLIRIYTKEPGERIHSEEPFIFRQQVTVSDLAERIHTRFLRYFKYARVWGSSCKYPGERVGLDHRLRDRDIVEIRVR